MRRVVRSGSIVITAACAGLGCATAPHTTVATRASTTHRERTTISYDSRGQLPLVHGSIAGKPTLMVVDTGTGANVVASWILRGGTTPSPSSHDPSGRSVPMSRSDTPQLAIDGFDPVPDRSTPVVDLPDMFEAAGIGAIISPQSLATADTMIVVDLPSREMRREPFRDLSATPLSPATFEVSPVSLCSKPGAGFGNKRLLTTALVDGISTVLEVDTGAFGNPFFVLADTEAGKHVLARATIRQRGMSAAGSQDVVSAPDVPVRIGERDRNGTVTVLPGSPDGECGVGGRLGIEWLRACVFSIGAQKYWLRCEERSARQNVQAPP